MSMSVSIEGVEKARKELERIGAQAGKAMAGGLRIEGEKILAASQGQVPVDTGILKSSGTVLGPEITAGKATVTIGYGGAAKAYAWRQHEELTWRHSNGQKAKYLEDPFLAHVRGPFLKNMAALLDSVVKRG